MFCRLFVIKFYCIFIIYILLLKSSWVLGGRTQKASKAALQKIKQLINEKAQKEVLQNDAILLAYDDATHYKHNQESKPHHDELRVNNPDEYYQGDVDLTKWQALKLQTQILDSLGDESTTKRHKRKIGKEPLYKRWDKRKPIIYDFADSIPAETRDKIKQALNIWQKGTCLRFKEGGPDVDRLEFFDGGGCSSFVGKTGGTQGISISTPGCDQVGIIAHEIGHALALFHEQARPDQLENIAIHYQNIPVSRWNNFHPVTDNQAATFGLPYDTGSVMHYGAYGFSSDPYRPTISTIDRNFQTTINEAYKCRENCKNSLSCLHGGYPHPNNCYTCLCPAGFQGQFCELVVTNTLCGGIITASTTPTHIQTPNYPNPFPHGQACIWLLQAPPTGHLFLQFIDNFHYQCEDTCDKSFVEVKTGPDFRPTGYRFCCSVVPSQVFQSGEQEMLIMHFANDQVSTGFRAKVWTDKEVVQPHLPSTAMPTTTDELTTPSTTTIVTTTESEATTNSISSTSPPTTTILPVWPFTLFGTSSISPFTLPGEATTLSPFTTPGAGILTALVTSSAGSSITDQKCICQGWTEWSACSQMCGGCGKRSRKRECASVENCQVEEKRTCNFQACPQGTNFLFNNSEFHILWKSCCVGLFRSKDQCTALENGENAFLRIISSLLSAQDSKNNSTIAKLISDKNQSRLLRGHFGEH